MLKWAAAYGFSEAPRDIEGESGKCEYVFVYALTQAACALIVVDILLDFGGAVAGAYVELHGKALPYGIQIARRESGSPEMTCILAVGIYIVVVAQLSVYAAEEAAERGVFAQPVAGFQNIGSETLKFLSMRVMMLAVSRSEPYGILFLK